MITFILAGVLVVSSGSTASQSVAEELAEPDPPVAIEEPAELRAALDALRVGATVTIVLENGDTAAGTVVFVSKDFLRLTKADSDGNPKIRRIEKAEVRRMTPWDSAAPMPTPAWVEDPFEPEPHETPSTDLASPTLAPVQGAIAGAGSTERRGVVATAYLGGVFDIGPPGAVFLGLGVEGTYGERPHNDSVWSFGPEMRVGRAWMPSTPSATRVPNVYVYAQVTPFVSSDDPPPGTRPQPDRRRAGVRVGVGVTAPGSTRAVARSGACASHPYALLFLLDHLEVTGEVSGETAASLEARTTVRVGLGF